MNTLALVKYSLDVAEIRVDASARALRLRGVPERFGDTDKMVVEAAVRVKEESGGTVRLICFGPSEARAAAKDLLAMGADEATIIEDPFSGSLDPALVVRIIERAIHEYPQFDLIVAGFASDDGYSHQTAGRIAERLSLPFVSYVREVSVDDDGVTMVRDLEDCLETVRVGTPAVISIAEESLEPRRVTLLQAMKAQKIPITFWSLEDLALDAEEIDSARTTHEIERRAVVVQRRQQVLKRGSLAELADGFIDLLLEEEALK